MNDNFKETLFKEALFGKAFPIGSLRSTEVPLCASLPSKRILQCYPITLQAHVPQEKFPFPPAA